MLSAYNIMRGPREILFQSYSKFTLSDQILPSTRIRSPWLERGCRNHRVTRAVTSNVTQPSPSEDTVWLETRFPVARSRVATVTRLPRGEVVVLGAAFLYKLTVAFHTASLSGVLLTLKTMSPFEIGPVTNI